MSKQALTCGKPLLIEDGVLCKGTDELVDEGVATEAGAPVGPKLLGLLPVPAIALDPE